MIKVLVGCFLALFASAVGAQTIGSPSLQLPLSVAQGGTGSSAAGQISGVATNTAASAGNVGQVLTASAAAVATPNVTAQVVTSVSLTPGDWDVYCAIKLNAATGTTVSSAVASVSNTAGLDLNIGQTTELAFSGVVTGAGFTQQIVSPAAQYLLASTTTIYCVTYVNYGTSTLTTDGFIRARRMR